MKIGKAQIENVLFALDEACASHQITEDEYAFAKMAILAAFAKEN